ncbi:MAG: histidine kinase [Paucimonas sp.]|jgi:signal transduction histidine kinase|nr:histidine kinase [Paucimonas sp.]
MTLASDQNDDENRLSATSRRMLELREIVLSEWEQKVRRSFEEAKQLRSPIIINTIPAFYDNIAEAVTADYPRSSATESNSLASEHGGERARLTHYDPETLIMEYQIFRATILDVMDRHGVTLTPQELRAINTSIDDAIREAVMAFSLVVTGMREQFIAALTHDMRGPLGVASMAAELIRLTTDSPKTQELSTRILENIARVDAMVQELLDTIVFQHGQKLKLEFEQFDMLSLVHTVLRHMDIPNDRPCDVVGEPVTGWWSRDVVKRSIENLIGNAVKYGAANTPIHIKLSQTHERVGLSVHNEGPQIPPEEQECIFQIFRRAEIAKHGKQKGWGIGLPFVRTVVESHGGSIVVDSSSEKGTTFTIDLPVDARPFQGEKENRR